MSNIRNAEVHLAKLQKARDDYATKAEETLLKMETDMAAARAKLIKPPTPQEEAAIAKAVVDVRRKAAKQVTEADALIRKVKQKIAAMMKGTPLSQTQADEAVKHPRVGHATSKRALLLSLSPRRDCSMLYIHPHFAPI